MKLEVAELWLSAKFVSKFGLSSRDRKDVSALPVPQWKWEGIPMEFVNGVLMSWGRNAIWIVVN